MLRNYTILLDAANGLDDNYKNPHTKQLLYTILKIYIPLIANELSKIRKNLAKSDMEHVDKKIEDLRDRYGGIDIGQWTEIEYLSPLVLLLKKLANEVGKISFGEEMNDWGRLGAYRDIKTDSFYLDMSPAQMRILNLLEMGASAGGVLVYFVSNLFVDMPANGLQKSTQLPMGLISFKRSFP